MNAYRAYESMSPGTCLSQECLPATGWSCWCTTKWLPSPFWFLAY